MSKIAIYYNTIRYLRLSQLLFLVINRLKSKRRISTPRIISYKISNLIISSVDYDSEWIERFNIDLAFNGRIRLLNEIVELNFSETYLSHLTPLLRNNVLYMEYAIALGVKYNQTHDIKYVNCFLKLYKDYLDSNCSPSSYIYSLHIPNIILTLNLLGEALNEQELQRIIAELFIQYKYIQRHQEKHLLANHYLENLKALVIGSLVFGENKKFKKYYKAFRKELIKQINDDGLHFELSAMYHKIILEDLLRVYRVLQSFGRTDTDWLEIWINKMSNAAFAMESGFNRTPLFNDAGDNVSKSISSLIRAAKEICGFTLDTSHTLSSSGYFRLNNRDISVIFDAGKPGPEYQPGHVHNDCLSFELAYKGRLIFVNCGTLLYQGKLRQFFRSTMAHNTVMIEGVEQSQCWGEHRVAKRCKVISTITNEREITAEIEDYMYNKIKRCISLEGNLFSVLDSTSLVEGKYVCSYLHVPIEFHIEVQEKFIRIGDFAVISPVNCKITKYQECDYAPEFGKSTKCTLLEFRWYADDYKHGYQVNFI